MAIIPFSLLLHWRRPSRQPIGIPISASIFGNSGTQYKISSEHKLCQILSKAYVHFQSRTGLCKWTQKRGLRKCRAFSILLNRDVDYACIQDCVTLQDVNTPGVSVFRKSTLGYIQSSAQELGIFSRSTMDFVLSC